MPYLAVIFLVLVFVAGMMAGNMEGRTAMRAELFAACVESYAKTRMLAEARVACDTILTKQH